MKNTYYAIEIKAKSGGRWVRLTRTHKTLRAAINTQQAFALANAKAQARVKKVTEEIAAPTIG